MTERSVASVEGLARPSFDELPRDCLGARTQTAGFPATPSVCESLESSPVPGSRAGDASSERMEG